MEKLYILAEKEEYTGWGVCVINLYNSLQKFCKPILIKPEKKVVLDAPVFVPIVTHNLKPLYDIQAPIIVGYGFWEWELQTSAADYAKRYKWIFAGSRWSAKKILKVTTNCSVLLQGVNLEQFKIEPYPEREGFRVFSGGKFEFRKGQDIVIAVMRELMAKYPDILLVTSWFNLWPKTERTMEESVLIDVDEPLRGLPLDRVFQKKILPNNMMSGLYGQTDIGLFPNRGEGGTNLVMMEYMASGRPVIASYATGQKDILQGDGPIKIVKGIYDEKDWFHANLSTIYQALEEAYCNKEINRKNGLFCRKLVEPHTWDVAAENIVKTVFN